MATGEGLGKTKEKLGILVDKLGIGGELGLDLKQRSCLEKKQQNGVVLIKNKCGSVRDKARANEELGGDGSQT
ncbi:hypothetical protein V6N13_051922 [Hibiscus sabdariffa]